MPKRTPEDVIRDAAPTARLQRDLDRLRGENRELHKGAVAAQERIALLERVDGAVPRPPRWVVKAPKRGHRGILTLLLSDCHFDEVVNPHEVEGANAYNRDIAVRRLRTTLDKAVMLSRHYFSGVQYEGFVLLLGGDMLSGAIHEELIETNQDTVFGSLDFWIDQLIAFVGPLADEFGKVHVAGVVGNHGRRTRKPVAKRRVRDNLDWLMYRQLAKAFRTDDRLTWQLPESADTDVPIYDTTIRLTHGDQFRGGAGIVGMLSPIMLGQHRKAQRQQALGKTFDLMALGHWHQYVHGRGVVVNGSVKGYDEYAYVNNFAYEPPQQAFFLVTPEHGASLAAPIRPADARLEGWGGAHHGGTRARRAA